MIPFKVYDRKNKVTWVVLNYHAATDKYLAAREDETKNDGDIHLIDAADITHFRMIGFVDSHDNS